MGYYDNNTNVEDAIIIEEVGAENTINLKKGQYSEATIKKLEALKNKEIGNSVYEKTSISLKVGMTFCLIGISYAVWKRKNWIAWGVGSTMTGLLVGNVISKSVIKN